MATPVDIDNILRLTVNGLHNGTELIQNVFYTRMITNDPTPDGVLNAENIAAGLWYTYYNYFVLPVCNAVLTFQTVTADLMIPDTGEFVNVDTYPVPTAEQTGGGAGQDMGPFVAYKIRKSRPNGSFKHSYTWLPGVSEDFQNAGVISDPVYVLLVAFAGFLALGFTAAHNDDGETVLYTHPSNPLVVPQFVLNGDPLPFPNFAIPGSLIVSHFTTTQNRRKKGVGA